MNTDDPLRLFERRALRGMFGPSTLALEGASDVDADPTLRTHVEEQQQLEEAEEVLAALQVRGGLGARLAGWLHTAVTAEAPTSSTASVCVSDLGDGARAAFEAAAGVLYDDVVHRGFFARPPSTVRLLATVASLAVAAVGLLTLARR